MAVDIEVDYSPALTEAERQMLLSIKSPVADCVWRHRSISHTCWRPMQDQNGRALYCLAPFHKPDEILLYYIKDEIGRLNPENIESDITFKHRLQVPPGFSDRPEN